MPHFQCLSLWDGNKIQQPVVFCCKYIFNGGSPFLTLSQIMVVLYNPRLGNILCTAKWTHLSQTACKLAIYKMTHGLIGVGITDSTEFGMR